MKKIILLGITLLSFVYVFSQSPNWNVDSENFQYSSTLTGVVLIDGVESVNTQDIVGAFVLDECRGIASPIYVESINRYMVFLMVYSNEMTSEMISIQVYSASEDSIYSADFEFEFIPESSHGYINLPVVFSNEPLNNETDFVSFLINGTEGIIDTGAHTVLISCNCPNLNNVAPEFTLSEGAIAMINHEIQNSNVTTYDFTSDVIYTVFAENGFYHTDWTVTALFTHSGDNNLDIDIETYPNPTKNKLTILNAEGYEINVYNCNGVLIYAKETIDVTHYELNTNDYSDGVYFIHLTNNSHTITKKVIIK